MTATLAKEITRRFHSIMLDNCDVEVVEGEKDDEQLHAVFSGALCSIVVRQGDTLYMVYVPRHLTQFWFDAYGQL